MCDTNDKTNLFFSKWPWDDFQNTDLDRNVIEWMYCLQA